MEHWLPSLLSRFSLTPTTPPPLGAAGAGPAAGAEEIGRGRVTTGNLFWWFGTVQPAPLLLNGQRRRTVVLTINETPTPNRALTPATHGSNWHTSPPYHALQLADQTYSPLCARSRAHTRKLHRAACPQQRAHPIGWPLRSPRSYTWLFLPVFVLELVPRDLQAKAVRARVKY